MPFIVNPDGEVTAQVFANSIDNGSFDACSDISLAIRRIDDPCNNNADVFGESIAFCCDDMTASSIEEISVELRVTDDSGNTSIVRSFVRLQDNSQDETTCPEGLVFGCDDDRDDFMVTGVPSSAGICGPIALNFDLDAIAEATIPFEKPANAEPSVDLDGDGEPDAVPAFNEECNYGALRREFISDGNIICTQFLVVIPERFDPSTIVWPADVEGTCSEVVMSEPTFDDTPCGGDFGVAVVLDTFPSSCLLYTSPSPRDKRQSRMPSSA